MAVWKHFNWELWGFSMSSEHTDIKSITHTGSFFFPTGQEIHYKWEYVLKEFCKAKNCFLRSKNIKIRIIKKGWMKDFMRQGHIFSNPCETLWQLFTKRKRGVYLDFAVSDVNLMQHVNALIRFEKKNSFFIDLFCNLLSFSWEKLLVPKLLERNNSCWSIFLNLWLRLNYSATFAFLKK